MTTWILPLGRVLTRSIISNFRFVTKLSIRSKRAWRPLKNATSKAKSLASGFERELGDVWRVDYNAQSSQPVLMRSMAMDARTESNSYEDSTITIRDRVNVIYQLEE
eukprot:TRINITY_DN3426_c0_g1_i1.p1 TRINITY_DN3426_c0_g1~~TRINITY_DN3426_c0_g1_i1.p1  ORF type:complete len:107 (-),score=2.78 TRINITY_DN3426_c0_g1_i1:155-475(-)